MVKLTHGYNVHICEYTTITIMILQIILKLSMSNIVRTYVKYNEYSYYCVYNNW